MNTYYLGADEADEAIRAEKWHETGPEREPEPVFVRRSLEEVRASNVARLYDLGFDADGNPLPTEDQK